MPISSCCFDTNSVKAKLNCDMFLNVKFENFQSNFFHPNVLKDPIDEVLQSIFTNFVKAKLHNGQIF